MPETYKEHSYEQIQEALNNEKSAKEYYEKGINVLNKYIDEVKNKENLFWKDATKPFEELKTKLKTLNYESVWTEYGRSHKNNINMVADHISAVEKNVLSNLKKQREEKQKQDKIKQTQMDRNSSIYSAMNISVSEKTGIQFSRLIQTDNNNNGKTGEIYDDNPNLDSNANTNLGGFYFREAVNNIQAKTVLNKLFSTNKNALFEVSYDQCSNSNIRKRMLDGGVKYLLCKDGKYVYANENKQILNITPAFWYGVHLKDIGTVINGEFKESTFITNKKEQEKKEDEKQKEQNELKKQEIDKKIQSILQGIKLVSFNNEQGYNITNSITKLFHDRNQYENYLTSGDLQPLLDFRDNISDNNPFNPQDLINIVEEIIKNISTMKKRNQETAKLVQTGFFEESTNGTLECTKAVNSYTINQIGLKKDQVYQIDYSFMTNPTLKERISKYKTGDYPIFMMKYDTVINGFVLIDEKGTVLSEEGKYIRPPVWEGVNINNTKNIEIKAKIEHRVQQNEQRRSEEARIKGLKSETIQIDLPEEERKEALDAIPFSLKQKIQEYYKEKGIKVDISNNDLLNKLVYASERRLNDICMDMSQKGYRLQIDSVSKAYGEGLMEIHFINGDTTKDITMRTDEGNNHDIITGIGIGPELATILDDSGVFGYDSNETKYMQYLKKRIGVKMEKYSALRPKTLLNDVEISINENEKRAKLEQQKEKFEKIGTGCSLLKTYIMNAREKEGKSYFTSYDEVLVGALEQIEKIENTIEDANNQEKILDIDKMLAPFTDLFKRQVRRTNIKKGIALGPFHTLSQEDAENSLNKIFKKIFLGIRNNESNIVDDPQNEGIRDLASLLSLYNITESSSSIDDSILSENFEFNDKERNELRKKIDIVFSEPTKIDRLFQSTSKEEICKKLIEAGVIKEEQKDKKEVINGCKILLDKIKQKKKSIEEVKQKLENSDFRKTKMAAQRERLNYLERNASLLNDGQHEEELKELAGLQRLKNDPTFFEEVKKQAIPMLNSIKYIGFTNDIKLTLAPHFFSTDGHWYNIRNNLTQDISSNSDIANDRYGTGLFDFSDENAQALGDFCVDLVIDIGVGVATGWVGNAMIRMAGKLALKHFNKLKNANKFIKLTERQVKALQSSCIERAKKIAETTGELLEQTVNLTGTRLAQGVKNGEVGELGSVNDISDLLKTVALTKGLNSLNSLLKGGVDIIGTDLFKKKKLDGGWFDDRIRDKYKKYTTSSFLTQGILATVEGKIMDDFLTNTLVDLKIKDQQEKRDMLDRSNVPVGTIKGIVKTIGIQACQEKITGFAKQFYERWNINKQGNLVRNKSQSEKFDDLMENSRSIGIMGSLSAEQRDNVITLAGIQKIEEMSLASGTSEESTESQTTEITKPRAKIPPSENQTTDSLKVNSSLPPNQ